MAAKRPKKKLAPFQKKHFCTPLLYTPSPGFSAETGGGGQQWGGMVVKNEEGNNVLQKSTHIDLESGKRGVPRGKGSEKFRGPF